MKELVKKAVAKIDKEIDKYLEAKEKQDDILNIYLIEGAMLGMRISKGIIKDLHKELYETK